MTVSKSHQLKPGRLAFQYRTFFLVLLLVLLIGTITSMLLYFLPESLSELKSKEFAAFSLVDLDSPLEVLVKPPQKTLSPQKQETCHYYNCFDVYRCGKRESSQISIYIYPPRKFVDLNGIPVTSTISTEFYRILKTILKSRYYTANPEEACILVPSLDLLNQNQIRLKETGWALQMLPYWNGGENHLLFNMLSGSAPDFSTVLEVESGSAMIAGAGFSSLTYRQGFDISIPMYNPFLQGVKLLHRTDHGENRQWLIISAQANLHQEYREELENMAAEHQELLLLSRCEGSQFGNYSVRCREKEVYQYPHVLREARFCLALRGVRLGQLALLEAMMAGCIPVVIADSYIMPFSEVLDWKKAAVLVYEEDFPNLIHILQSISEDRVEELSEQVEWFYQQYFQSIEHMTRTVLEILNDRVFPQNSRSYDEWNTKPHQLVGKSPLFLPMTASKAQGFTAVILTYDRLESLFQVILKVVKAPSLAKVLVVWNNQKKPPPHPSIWPKINKPLKVVQTRENKLSNRFYPYEEIETEAILAIDDDIIMLTADELEFGFEVWREFPDRIVGFPSRTHVWDNVTQRWKYESEWTNEISMVLTGAAFYHKYWSYLYTTSMPGDIKSWVDSRMNCEDIAMNFLVANVTGKSPIKVTPRKKFKCPECVNNEMLSADLSHMMERSDCINRFTAIYGTMPLKTVEFRADPVLYKDNFPEKLKRFHDIGNL